MARPKLPPESEASIRTGRLELQPLRRAHAKALYPILSDMAIYEFMGGSPPSSEESLAEEYARSESRHSPDGRELWLNWLIRERECGAAIGYAQATVASAHTHVAWVIGPRWQGRGYASEAARGVISWLIHLGATEIRAHIPPGHVASQRVALHAGLRRTGQVCEGEDVWLYEATGHALA